MMGFIRMSAVFCGVGLLEIEAFKSNRDYLKARPTYVKFYMQELLGV